MSYTVDPARTYSLAQASVILGKSESTVRRYLKAGMLQSLLGADLIYFADASPIDQPDPRDGRKYVYHVLLTEAEAAELIAAGWSVTDPRERRAAAAEARRARALADLQRGK